MSKRFKTAHPRRDELSLWQLAGVEAIFLVAAATIIYYRHSAGAIVLRTPLPEEGAIGLSIGVALGTALGHGLLHSRLRGAVVRGILPLRAVTTSAWSIAVLGVLAGCSEELLFRAALQPWIGISWASLLFGIAHSGTARLNEGVSAGKLAYVLMTVVAGVLLGLLYQAAGLLAVVSAHVAFDVAILCSLAPAIAAEAAGSPTKAM